MFNLFLHVRLEEPICGRWCCSSNALMAHLIVQPFQYNGLFGDTSCVWLFVFLRRMPSSSMRHLLTVIPFSSSQCTRRWCKTAPRPWLEVWRINGCAKSGNPDWWLDQTVYQPLQDVLVLFSPLNWFLWWHSFSPFLWSVSCLSCFVACCCPLLSLLEGHKVSLLCSRSPVCIACNSFASQW